MTERKPMGMTFDSWVDRQIDASIKRGEFENLPGKGEPLPGVNGRYDPDWWLKEKLARENLDITPDTIVARRKAEVFMERYLDLGSVSAVKREAAKLPEIAYPYHDDIAISDRSQKLRRRERKAHVHPIKRATKDCSSM